MAKLPDNVAVQSPVPRTSMHGHSHGASISALNMAPPGHGDSLQAQSLADARAHNFPHALSGGLSMVRTRSDADAAPHGFRVSHTPIAGAAPLGDGAVDRGRIPSFGQAQFASRSPPDARANNFQDALSAFAPPATQSNADDRSKDMQTAGVSDLLAATEWAKQMQKNSGRNL